MTADPRMSRARLYVLVDAFEQDMRNIVERYLLDHLTEAEALGLDFAAADNLRAKDPIGQNVSIVHYLYLRQCYDILNRQRLLLPDELSSELRVNTARLDSVVPVRNRVMHGRPLRTDDPEVVVSALQGFRSRHWAETKKILDRLHSDAAWEPSFETLPVPQETTLHNLPHADYDETGLVGRSEDKVKLVELLKRRREPIITVTGEGGIGKTALALDVAYTIVDDPSSPFDCVLWVSLKREMLTAYGVREISTAIRDITGAAESLGKVIDRSFIGSVAELAEMLDGINALIIIDNLESAQGSEVIGLYDNLPSTTTYFFTSRLGIGEIERRYPLGPLRKRDAIQLFRRFAKRRGQDRLSCLDENVAERVLERLRYSPLAIRWYVLSVEAGHEPAATLHDQKELLDFCIRNVYESLSEKSRATLSILYSLDRSVSFDELAVLTDLPIDDLRQASQEMSRGSLVVHEADPGGGLASRLSLSAAARMFLPSQANAELLTTEILHRELEYVKGAEKRRAEEAERRLGPNVVRVRGPEDEPTAHLLRIALSISKTGDMDRAQTYIERARSLNPDFWEVDRVDAFLAFTRHHRERAATLYRSAFSKADTAESRAIVCHFFAGHLARAMRETELALPYAEEAHAVLNCPETALALGNLRVWNGQFAEGQELLEVALEDADGRAKLIALTGVVESWRKWAEQLLESRLPAEALDKAGAGFSIGTDAIGQGYLDGRLAGAVVEAAFAALRAAAQPGLDNKATDARIAVMLNSLTVHVDLYKTTRAWRRLLGSLARWLRETPMRNSTRVTGSSLLQSADPLTDKQAEFAEGASGRLVGEVVSWRGTYGFINHPDYPSNLFFHKTALWDPDTEPLRGTYVYFTVDQDDQGRLRATALTKVKTNAT